ncbi:MAG: TRAM domain-containing protein [Ardenticatenaceae bacterium]|nr:TRAM domain-containing protein [Ardenticatenaceae bacterium]
MNLSIEFFLRLAGAFVGAIILGFAGNTVAKLLQAPIIAYTSIFSLLGVLGGLILTPYFTVRPVRRLRQNIAVMPAERLLAIIVGIFLGLIAAALFALPLSLLPPPFRQILPILTAFFFCYVSVVLFTMRQNDLRGILPSMRTAPTTAQAANNGSDHDPFADAVLLDTSVIIDGRITDISKTGFIRSTLLVPNFILLELQHIADSSDTLRRNRGRRGLDVLGILRNEAPVPIKITDMDVTEVKDADSKLVALARHLKCPIMTNDYNLNRVADLQGVSVLNINDLANAVKAAYLPGETLRVEIIQEGKEMGQGVGYLEDGTMVVVEDGRSYIDRTLEVTVTKVLQTTAGRMVFARH